MQKMFKSKTIWMFIVLVLGSALIYASIPQKNDPTFDDIQVINNFENKFSITV